MEHAWCYHIICAQYMHYKIVSSNTTSNIIPWQSSPFFTVFECWLDQTNKPNRGSSRSALKIRNEDNLERLIAVAVKWCYQFVWQCPWVLSRLISSSKERFESGEPETKVCAGVRDPEPGVGMNMNVPVYTVQDSVARYGLREWSASSQHCNTSVVKLVACIPSPWGQAGFGWSGTPAIWNKMRR